jgi:outer membrane lipoprotein-sorting protein
MILSLAVLPFSLQGSQPVAPLPVPAPEGSETSGLESDITGAERDALLDEIAAALADVKTAKGRFTQQDPAFNTVSGDFYLRRPGRVRFVYDAPSPLLIVSDGTSVAIEDKDLETQDRLPLRATPLGLILDDKIDFAEQVNILGVRKTENIVGVLMEDKTGETEGSLLLVLDAADYGLLEWQAIDPEGGVTSVQLAGVETGISLNPRLFRIEELDEEDERD